jgi:hypothetical protein
MWLARASALDRKPRAHLAVGSGQEIAEVRREVRREAGVSGRCGRCVTARVVSRRAPLRLSRPLGDAAACPGSTRRRIEGRSFGMRLAVGGRRDARGCTPSRTLHRAGTGEGGVPPGRRRRWGQAHPLVGSGSRQRLLERRQRRSQERPGASLFPARARSARRRRAPAVALATARARTAPAKRRRPMEVAALAAVPASPRCRPWHARSRARSAGPGDRGRGAAGSAARWRR